MSKTATILLATALLALVAAGFAGCGGNRSNLIPSTEAQQIDASLTQIQALADNDKCFIALNATKKVLRQVESLPSSVDPDLKRSLLDGVVALQLLIGDPDKCTQSTTEPTAPDTNSAITPTGDTGVTTPEVTAPTDEKKNTGKKEPDKKPEKPTPAPTPEPTPKPTPETPPSTDPPVDPGPGSGGVSPNQ